MASRSLLVHLLHLAATPVALWSVGCAVQTCVAAGTRVVTPRGPVAVEALRPGDVVFAVDVSTGARIEATIAAVRSGRRECLVLACEGQALRVTPDHPIYSPELGGFVEAGRLALGQVTTVLRVDAADERARVAAVGACEAYAGVFDVYDLTLAGDHPTFIAEGFVVHNKSTYEYTNISDVSVSDPYLTTTGVTDSGTGSESGETAGSEGSTGSSGGGESTGGSSTGSSSTGGSSTGGSSTGDGTSSGGADTGGVTFPCGDKSCALGGEYCQMTYPGVPDAEISYTCVALSDACLADPSCACLEAEGLRWPCSPTPEGGLVVMVFTP